MNYNSTDCSLCWLKDDIGRFTKTTDLITIILIDIFIIVFFVGALAYMTQTNNVLGILFYMLAIVGIMEYLNVIPKIGIVDYFCTILVGLTILIYLYLNRGEYL